MGEYAKHNGEQVKIGTCEDMYYLRTDQLEQIEGYHFDSHMLGVVRFRFPFPDEDGIEPGQFEDYGRGERVPGYSLPAELSGDEHHSVQFTSSAGYVLSIPCPEQFGTPGLGPVDVDGVMVHRNGFRGYPVVSQQAYRGGHLVTLLRCGACGAVHRLDTIDDAQPVIDAFRAEAERQESQRDGWGPAHSPQAAERLMLMAARIETGYYVKAEIGATA